MSKCKDIRPLFPEALFQEIDDTQNSLLREHLQSCSGCRKEYEEMQGTIKMMDKQKVPDPGEEYFADFYERIENELSEETADTAKFPSLLNNAKPWIYRITAAAAMILFGFYLGSLNSPGNDPIKSDDQNNGLIRRTAMDPSADKFLQDSRVLLLGFVNMDTDEIDPAGLDFSKQQDYSRGLIRQAADLKKKMEESKNTRLLNLISELEMIFMQIGNYESEFDLPAVEVIRSGVENRGLLFKINLEELIASASKEQSAQPKTKRKINL